MGFSVPRAHPFGPGRGRGRRVPESFQSQSYLPLSGPGCGGVVDIVRRGLFVASLSQTRWGAVGSLRLREDAALGSVACWLYQPARQCLGLPFP